MPSWMRITRPRSANFFSRMASTWRSILSAKQSAFGRKRFGANGDGASAGLLAMLCSFYRFVLNLHGRPRGKSSITIWFLERLQELLMLGEQRRIRFADLMLGHSLRRARAGSQQAGFSLASV